MRRVIRESRPQSVFLSHDIPISRKLFPQVRRVIVKIGTSIVTSEGGTFALSRLGGIAEQIDNMMQRGIEVILVSSGSVVKGTQVLSEQQFLSKTMRSVHHRDMPPLQAHACAAAGQSGMMAFYDSLFSQKGIYVSQVLISRNDLKTLDSREGTDNRLRHTIDTLLNVGVLPIVNENDTVSSDGPSLCNDELASLIGYEVDAELVILLTDVGGVYTKHPDEHGSELISVYNPNTSIEIGEKSTVGRGGMGSKMNAALKAVERGVPAVVIASGYKGKVIDRIMNGAVEGTLFVKNPDILEEASPATVARDARKASIMLRNASPRLRDNILRTLAKNLDARKLDIFSANETDLAQAEADGITGPLFNRLKFTQNKLDALIDGINHLADSPDPLAKSHSRTEISKDLYLQKESTPLGVLLIIFESRPDVLPQIASLAIKSGNGVILKGGKEALNSNKLLHEVIIDSINEACGPDASDITKQLVVLIEDRSDVDGFLQLHHDIDLVIPRGSYQLVRHIQSSTMIPVMGHAEGVCHLYLHKDAPLELAVNLTIDSKMDYPSACNAVETVIVHSEFMHKHGAAFWEALRAAGIKINAAPVAHGHLIELKKDSAPLQHDFHHEYGDNELTLTEVPSLDDAVIHINLNGSGHTDCIVTASNEDARTFQSGVDSACAFHNASTRFADGYRFGLGAEVGISTNRIHARGPVGVDGLMTMKWKLVSTAADGHTVGQFAKGESTYTHKPLGLGPHPAFKSSHVDLREEVNRENTVSDEEEANVEAPAL